MKTRVGYEQAKTIQTYQTLITVAGLIFGEKKVEPAQSAREVEQSMAAMFGAEAIG